MKTIDGKFYGYEYELKADPTVADLTEFRALDSGSLFIAFNGLWYEQPVKWAELDALRPVEPEPELPEVTASDNGDVLTVVEGAWANAAPSGGGATVVELTVDAGTGAFTSTMKAGPLWEAATTGPVLYVLEGDGDVSVGLSSGAWTSDGAYVFAFDLTGGPIELVASTINDYPSSETGEPT